MEIFLVGSRKEATGQSQTAERLISGLRIPNGKYGQKGRARRVIVQ